MLHHLIDSSISDQLSDIKSHEDIKYTDSVTFHCYWDNNIGPNQLFSILSCYLTNVKDTNNKIILWHDFDIKECIEKPIYKILSRFCEVKFFDHLTERVGTPLESYEVDRDKYLSLPPFYSDYLRLIMLYKYGGMWFDLDILFFKNFDYLFSKYDSFFPNWGKRSHLQQTIKVSNHPNNAIVWCRDKNIIKRLIERFLKYGGGHFAIQDTFGNRKENQIHFSSENLEINVLPCAWIDSMWVDNPSDFELWFKNNNNEYFYDDAYCYHWHNRNHLPIEKNSPFYRRMKIIIEELGLQNTIKI